VSGALILFQITMTRILSVVVWYHFAYLILSVVMLGIGVPGVWLSLVHGPRRYLEPLLLAAGAAIPLSVFVLVRYGTVLNEWSVLLVVACLLPAVLAMGGALCILLIQAPGRTITRMYGLDLAGAGLAALAVVPLMIVVPTPQLAAASGLLPLAAYGLYPRRGLPTVVLIAAMAALVAAGSPFKVRRSKAYDETVRKPLYETWTPIARLTVFDETFYYLEGHAYGFAWGRGTNSPHDREVAQYWIEQDGSAGTPIPAFEGDPSRFAHLLYDVTSAGYQVRPARTVAVIGAGGGRDVLTALQTGATGVDAVEINPRIVDIVSRRFAAFSGDVYHAPGVHAVVSEGRSFLTRTHRRYDAIQISLIDSWAASAAGAYALMENALYTVEAFDLYLDRLRPEGLLAVSRWMPEMPWLIGVARRALERRGADPRSHVMLVQGGRLGTLLVSPTPFTDTDRERLFETALARGFTILYPVPPRRRAVDPVMVTLVEAGLDTLGRLGAETEPARDDRPYFFNAVSPFSDIRGVYRRVFDATGINIQTKAPLVLRSTILTVSGLALALLLVFPGWILRRRSVAPAVLGTGSLYFAAIGAGFMLLETVTVQRFVLYLGNPAYAFTAVLASLLVGMGAGSMGAERFGLRRLGRWGPALPVVLAVLSVTLPFLFRATLAWPAGTRFLATGLLLVPVGMALGVYFPLGMIRFGDTLKPWFWAVNGFFGVVAGVFSLALSMEFGFRAVGLLAAAAYALAWIALRDEGAVTSPAASRSS
jgi:hypothetical protein